MYQREMAIDASDDPMNDQYQHPRKQGKEKDEYDGEASRGHQNNNSGQKGNQGKNRIRSTDKFKKLEEENPFTQLNAPRAAILKAVEMPPPPVMHKKPNERSRNKWCEYHNDHRHNTEDCFQLKKIIQQRINNGELAQWVRGNQSPQNNRGRAPRGPNRRERDDDYDDDTYTINYINEEPPTNRQLSLQIKSLEKIYSIPPSTPEEEIEIGFKRSELAATLFHSQQPLTIRMRINKYNIGRVLIDTGASRDILYYHTLVEMKMSEAHLTPYAGLLEGFTNHTIHVKGTIDFDVTIGKKPM